MSDTVPIFTVQVDWVLFADEDLIVEHAEGTLLLAVWPR